MSKHKFRVNDYLDHILQAIERIERHVFCQCFYGGWMGLASVRPQFIEQLRVPAQQFEQQNGGFMRLGFAALVL